MVSNRQKGDLGEKIAVDFLIDKGYSIIKTNYQKRCGEIDIIASRGTYIHFIEVKYRKNIKNGYPKEAVTKVKQKKIISTALHYIEENKLQNIDFSFDVFQILDVEIEFIQNAFY